jgi:hypothetical protein
MLGEIVTTAVSILFMILIGLSLGFFLLRLQGSEE